MSSTLEVIINSPPPSDPSQAFFVTESRTPHPPGVLGFLKINPIILGWLEILTGAVALGLVFFNYERWILIPASFVCFSGIVTAIAACTRSACLVVTSQLLNFLNIFSAVAVIVLFFFMFFVVFTVRVALRFSLTTTDVAFMCIMGLSIIISIIISATSCCWCRARERMVVIHMNTLTPAGDAAQVDASKPVYCPPAYSPVPFSEPPAYECGRSSPVPVPSAPWSREELQQSRKFIQV